MTDTAQTLPPTSTPPKTFWDLLADGPLPQSQVIQIGIQTAAALEKYRTGIGKLALEMLSFAEDHVEIDPSMAGAPTLLAPEVVQGTLTTQDVKAVQLADIWSLGIMLYMLLAGHSPFGGITRSQQLKAITAPRPTPDIRNVSPEVSVDLAGLLYHMLQRNIDYRSRVATVETVRRTLEAILNEQEIPYSIPEFPVVEAKAILKDARLRLQAGKGALSESEYQLVRRLVDSGELKIDDEYVPLWKRSKRGALGRRLGARLIGSFLLGLSVPLVNMVGNVLFGNPNMTPQGLLEESIATYFVMLILNATSIAILTGTSHFSKHAQPVWWALPITTTLLAGALLVIFEMAGLTTLYSGPLQAFVVGAVVGLIIGGVYTFSMPRQRQDTILKQSRRPMIISALVGLIYGVLFLLTQYNAEMTFYTVASSLIGVPLLIICLLLSFVLGVELGDRYIER